MTAPELAPRRALEARRDGRDPSALAGRPTDAAHAPAIELAASVWQTGEPLWIPDSTQESRAQRALMPKETGLRTALLYPVRQGRRVVGVLDLSCRATRALEERLLDTLHAIGNQIGQLLQRAAPSRPGAKTRRACAALTNLTSDWYWEIGPRPIPLPAWKAGGSRGATRTWSVA